MFNFQNHLRFPMLLAIVWQIANREPVPSYIDILANFPSAMAPIFNAIVLYRFDMRIKREINHIIKGLLKRLGLESIYSSAMASSPDTQKTPLGLAKNIQPQSPNLNFRFGSRIFYHGPCIYNHLSNVHHSCW